jgi:hypothetical protein
MSSISPKRSSPLYSLTCCAYCPRGIFWAVVVAEWIHMVQSGATIACSCRLLLYSEAAKKFTAAIAINYKSVRSIYPTGFSLYRGDHAAFSSMQGLPIAYKSGVPLYSQSDLFLQHVRGFKADEVPLKWLEQLMW